MNITYYISSCPIPFHDLIEIFEFLSNLDPVRLYMFDGSFIIIESSAEGGKIFSTNPGMMIRVFYIQGSHLISYKMALSF